MIATVIRSSISVKPLDAKCCIGFLLKDPQDPKQALGLMEQVIEIAKKILI